MKGFQYFIWDIYNFFDCKWNKFACIKLSFSSKEVLHRSEAIGRLAAQISAKYDWASMDKGQIRDQLLKKQAPSFSGKLGKVRITEFCVYKSFLGCPQEY